MVTVDMNIIQNGMFMPFYCKSFFFLFFLLFHPHYAASLSSPLSFLSRKNVLCSDAALLP